VYINVKDTSSGGIDSVIRHQFSSSTKSKRGEFGILSKILLKIIVERYSMKAMGIEKV